MTTGDQEPTMTEVTATCRTAACTNTGAQITLTIPEGCGVVCGVCGQTITDITD